MLQDKLNDNMNRLHIWLISVSIILFVIAVVAWRHFEQLTPGYGYSVKLEQDRIAYVLAMVKGQWLSVGQPQQLKVDWQLFDGFRPQQKVVFVMSQGGWPVIEKNSDSGCQLLWYQLLGKTTSELNVDTFYLHDANTCNYIDARGDTLSYQLGNGSVIFSTNR